MIKDKKGLCRLVKTGNIDRYVDSMIMSIIMTEELELLKNVNLDFLHIFKISVEQGLIKNVYYLIQNHWDERYIDIAKYDDDILLDILAIFPSQYKNIICHIKNDRTLKYINKNINALAEKSVCV